MWNGNAMPKWNKVQDETRNGTNDSMRMKMRFHINATKTKNLLKWSEKENLLKWITACFILIIPLVLYFLQQQKIIQGESTRNNKNETSGVSHL